MKKLFSSCLLLIAFGLQLFAQLNTTSTNKKADSLFTRLMSTSRPQIKNWVYSTANKYRNKDVNENILKSNKEFSVLGNMNDGDIAALAFLVIMQASKDAENDMKQIMDNVKQTNNAKAQQRVLIEKNKKLKDSLHGNSEIKNNSDNLNDMTEMQQLRLQMYMDRRQKAMETISNLMKKIANTESSIIQNIK